MSSTRLCTELRNGSNYSNIEIHLDYQEISKEENLQNVNRIGVLGINSARGVFIFIFTSIQSQLKMIHPTV